MKKLITIIALVTLSVSVLSAQSGNGRKDPVGKWKFDAPYAPEGFTSGTIDVGYADKKYSATMSFAGSEYSFPGEKVAVRNDSLFFLIWVEGTDVNVALKLEDNSKMTGNAVYYEGNVPLSLTREPVQKP